MHYFELNKPDFFVSDIINKATTAGGESKEDSAKNDDQTKAGNCKNDKKWAL